MKVARPLSVCNNCNMNRFLQPSSEQIDPSQFAVLRLMLCLLAHRKGFLSRMEANWFIHQTRKFNLSKEQRADLHADLKHRPAVDLIFEHVQNQDLDILLRLLGLASKVDGKVTAEEKAFITDIEKMAKLRQLNPKEVYQKFVDEHMQRQATWAGLQEIGKTLSQRVSPLRRFRFFNPF